MIQNNEKVLLLRFTEIFKIYGSGIVTGRNQLALKNSIKEIHETVKMLSDGNVDIREKISGYSFDEFYAEI